MIDLVVMKKIIKFYILTVIKILIIMKNWLFWMKTKETYVKNHQINLRSMNNYFLRIKNLKKNEEEWKHHK